MRTNITGLLRAGNKIRKTMMYPIMWLFLFSLIGVVAIPLTGAPNWLLVVMAASYTSALTVAVSVFVYAFIWKPDRLETEHYRRNKKTKSITRP